MSVSAPAAVLAGAGDDVEWCAAARAWLTETQESLASRFDAGEGVSRLLRARTECVDAVVRLAWTRCLPDDGGLALLATGGYGRGELFPHSDVDLLVLAEPRAQQDASAALSRLFALLWD
ncbi:MAG: bifunctional uridylyltransferase/uridylyl-removing protein, partial [Gammaproteobacteria bacterium HGW-Gammaproteobacteria-7]